MFNAVEVRWQSSDVHDSQEDLLVFQCFLQIFDVCLGILSCCSMNPSLLICPSPPDLNPSEHLWGQQYSVQIAKISVSQVCFCNVLCKFRGFWLFDPTVDLNQNTPRSDDVINFCPYHLLPVTCRSKTPITGSRRLALATSPAAWWRRRILSCQPPLKSRLRWTHTNTHTHPHKWMHCVTLSPNSSSLLISRSGTSTVTEKKKSNRLVGDMLASYDRTHIVDNICRFVYPLLTICTLEGMGSSSSHSNAWYH